MNCKPNPSEHTAATHADPDTFHEWILSLPWVVERPYVVGAPGTRTFAVDCEPLGLRQLWLVTGLMHGRGVGLVVPQPLAEAIERVGLGRTVSPMPHEHALIGISVDVDCTNLERVILDAYGTLFS